MSNISNAEKILKGFQEAVFDKSEYQSFISFLEKNKSSYKIINANEVESVIMKAISAFERKLNAELNSISRNSVAKTLAFISYPGTGKTQSINAVFNALKNNNVIADYLYHDMMKYDPISAPFGVTVIRKSKDVPLDDNEFIEKYVGIFGSDSFYVKLVNEMFNDLTAYAYIQNSANKEKYADKIAKDYKFFASNKIGSADLMILIENLSNAIFKGGDDKAGIYDSVNFSDLYVMYYKSKLFVYSSLFTAIYFVGSRLNNGLDVFENEDRLRDLMMYLALHFILSVSLFYYEQKSETTDRASLSDQLSKFYAAYYVNLVAYFIRGLVNSVLMQNGETNEVISSIFSSFVQEIGANDFVAVSDEGINRIRFVLGDGKRKGLSKKYLNSLLDVFVAAFSKFKLNTSESENSNVYIGKFNEELDNLHRVLQNNDYAKSMFNIFYDKSGNPVQFNSDYISNVSVIVSYYKPQKPTIEAYELEDDDESKSRTRTYSESNEDANVIFVKNLYKYLVLDRTLLTAYESVRAFSELVVRRAIQNAKSIDKVSNIDYDAIKEHFMMLKVGELDSARDIKVGEDSLFFIFPKEVEDFINKARRDYERYAKKTREENYKNAKSLELKEYKVYKCPMYILFLDEFFHMFSGGGAPVVATVWDGLANRADKFPPNLMLVLAGNAPSGSFFNALENEQSKISVDSMKAFFDRLILSFVVPDTNYAYSFVSENNLSLALSKSGVSVSQKLQDKQKSEKNDLYNKFFMINNFDYYANVVLSRTYTKYCGESRKQSDNSLEKVVKYASGYVGVKPTIGKINLSKDKFDEYDFVNFYALISNMFNHVINKIVSDSGLKEKNEIYKKMLEKYEDKIRLYIDRYNNYLGIMRFAYTWLLSIVNSFSFISNVYKTLINQAIEWHKNFGDPDDRYPVPNILNVTGSDYLSIYEGLIGEEEVGSINTDLFVGSLFYTIVAIHYVAALYNNGDCLKCIENIAALYNTIIGDASDIIGSNTFQNEKFYAMIIPRSIDSDVESIVAVFDIKGVQIKFIVSKRMSDYNTLLGKINETYFDDQEALNIATRAIGYIQKTITKSMSVQTENGFIYIVPVMNNEKEALTFTKAVHVVARAFANRFGYSPNSSNFVQVISQYKKYLNYSQRTLTDEISKEIAMVDMYFVNMLKIFFMYELFTKENLLDFLRMHYDFNKISEIVNYNEEKMNLLYQETSAFIKRYYEENFELLFGCSQDKFKSKWVLKSPDLFNSEIKSIFKTADYIMSLNHTELMKTEFSMENIKSLQGDSDIERNLFGIDIKNSGDILNLLTIVPFYIKAKEDIGESVLSEIVNRLYRINTLESLKGAIDSYGLDRYFMESAIKNIGCEKAVADKFVSLIYDNVVDDDYGTLSERLFIDITDRDIQAMYNNEKIQKIYANKLSPILVKVMDIMKEQNNVKSAISAYEKLRTLLFDKFGNVGAKGAAKKQDMSCILEYMFYRTIYVFYHLYYNMYRDNKFTGTSEELEDKNMLVSAFNFVLDWSIVSYLTMKLHKEKEKNWREIAAKIDTNAILEEIKSRLEMDYEDDTVNSIVYKISEQIHKGMLAASNNNVYGYKLSVDYDKYDVQFFVEDSVDPNISVYINYLVEKNVIDLLSDSTTKAEIKEAVKSFLGVIFTIYSHNEKLFRKNFNKIYRLLYILGSLKETIITYEQLNYKDIGHNVVKNLVFERIWGVTGGNTINPTKLYYVNKGKYFVDYFATICPISKTKRTTVGDEQAELTYMHTEEDFLVISSEQQAQMDGTLYYAIPYLRNYVDLLLLNQNIMYVKRKTATIQEALPVHLIFMLFTIFRTYNLDKINNELDKLINIAEKSIDEAATSLLSLIRNAGHPHMFLAIYAFTVDNVFSEMLRDYIVNDRNSGWAPSIDEATISKFIQENVSGKFVKNFSDVDSNSDLEIILFSPVEIGARLKQVQSEGE